MRQAVIIIHGIGEQRPMDTLRAFVAGALGPERAFSKPDRIDETLELRRLHVPPGKHGGYVRNETDFYEFYWQHLMQAPGWRPVVEWLLYWLFHPWKLNTRLREVWYWLAPIAAIAALVAVAAFVVQWPALQSWVNGLRVVDVPLVALALLLAWKLGWPALKWITTGWLERFMLGYLGDVVRYLIPDPPNVASRHAIRTAGLKLLRGLHEDKLRRYERIILVGHSLGSVIAYDLITWFWQEQHHLVELDDPRTGKRFVETLPFETEPEPLPDDQSPLEDLHDQLPNLEAFRDRQWSLWQDHRKKEGFPPLPWLITDLVTLGSPLAHADVLIADGRSNLDRGICQREFPTCPPELDDPRDKGLLSRKYHVDGKTHEVCILHHGAPFVVTRWTNLYFPGDFIGGPLSDLLGKGIKDVELKDGHVVHRWLSHLHYWDNKEQKACEALKAALNLNETKSADDSMSQFVVIEFEMR